MNTKNNFLIRPAGFLFLLSLLLCGIQARAQVSSNITITPITTPDLTPCSGQGTFVVRVSNISASAISTLTFRDSMPSGINYVAGSVSGSGVTFGSTITANNVVIFNIANIPSNGFVDVSFGVAVSCSVSTNSANIKNTYRVNWGTFFTNPYTTSTYPLSFPSLSVTVDSPSMTAVCGTPFTRKITICNGGFGSLDSVTVTDVESNVSLAIVNFNRGTVTGANTNNAKTVLKAADFATIGNLDGKLDQGECIVVVDTLKGVSTASPVTGTITASWGCSGASCNNGSANNVYAVSTVISPASLVPALTRSSFTQITSDSSGQIFNRVTTYQEVIQNNSSAIAVNARIYYITKGLKYIDTGTIKASKNGGPQYTPVFTLGAPDAYSNPNVGMGNIVAPATYTGSLSSSALIVNLGDFDPGDSIVVTFAASTTGQVTRVSDASFSNNNGNFYYPGCSTYYLVKDGPSLGSVVDAYLSWTGPACSPGGYRLCQGTPPGLIFNGVSHVAEPAGHAPLYLARFRSFTFADSTAIQSNTLTCKTYYDADTVKLSMRAGAMDIPFYTDKSKLVIKVYTKGGVQWDGNLSKVYGRLTSWSNANWQADQVVDNSAVDSTISIYFKRSNCPVLSSFASNLYNSYIGGVFQLNMQFLNVCPGPALKELYLTRIYTIDTTSTDLAIESGPVGAYPFSWNSYCSMACADGIQIQSYSHARTSFGAPDNNNDGVADTTGSLNMTVVNTNLITWGDTLQLKYKMVVKTTQAGGVPYLYINTAINNTVAAANTLVNNTACNNMLKKTPPKIKLNRPGVGIFTATGTSSSVDAADRYTINLSLQGTGGVTLPGITTYQDGDTVEVTEDLVFWTPHTGFSLSTWNFIHIPYIATVADPAPAQQLKCDSISCAIFQTIDMNVGAISSLPSAPACSDSIVLRTGLLAQTLGASCGATFFPGEARDIATPSRFKMLVPSANWSVQRIYANWNRKINGTGNCGLAITNQLLPASLYSFSGDTLIMDLVQIGQFYGQDITINELRSYFYFDVGLKYTLSPGLQNCNKDHMGVATNFTIWATYSTTRPVDSTSIVNMPTSTVSAPSGNPISTIQLSWPGGNTNTVSTVSAVSVNSPVITLPVNYTKGSDNGNNFLAIPDRPGIIVDSVKDNVTGALVTTVPGSGIYQMEYLPLSTTRGLTVYTHVQACQNDTLFLYADRTPCTGLPANWSSYNCQNLAYRAFVRYNTFSGELQMQDSLYSTQKDMCTADTVQFNVYNSQTQDAHTIKIKFTLPAAMTLVPGQTQLKLANGSFVTVSDPVLSGGTYTWTQPAADTLRNINLVPDNAMALRCAVITECGYVSGSQITSSVEGSVACGPITSLFNANPPPLNINGAPSLDYFTNVQATVTQVTGCSATPGYDYRIAMHISGGTTGASDKVNVTLPEGYAFVSYNSSTPGSVHAPAGAPDITTLANGATQLSWTMPGAVAGGDSIIFTFKYNETSTAVNKCSASSLRNSYVNTVIASSAFCVTAGTNCTVAIGNGADTVSLQSLKPNITTTTSTVVYGDAFGAVTPGAKSYLHISGTLQNTGTAALAPGTDIIMEPFMDLDNSGTITPGDYAFTPFIYNGGMAMAGSYSYTYSDSLNASACPTCGNKNLLLRFSNNPSAPAGSSQCFCDSVSVMQVVPVNVPLELKLGDFNGEAQDCNHARLKWHTFEEKGNDLRFELQASVNGKDYQTMAMVPAKRVAGSDYTQTVAMPAATTYFRLILWADGESTYSPTLSVKSDCWMRESVAVYPNPFTNIVYIKGAKKDSEIVLMDVTGRKLLTQKAKGNEQDQLNMDRYAGGTYMITVMDESGITTTMKLSKN